MWVASRADLGVGRSVSRRMNAMRGTVVTSVKTTSGEAATFMIVWVVVVGKKWCL